ncbi:MAG: hypothetical protein ACPGU5_06605 [Lishizhenia sp.]
MTYNFELLKEGDFSLLLQESGIVTFNDACRFIGDIRYGRISNSRDVSLVFHERQGTCSSKHAFLKKVAEEQGAKEVELTLALFKMGAQSHPELAEIFKKHELDYIPEAHVYLKINGKVFDFTTKNKLNCEPYLIQEESVTIDFVLSEKSDYHKNFIKKWNKTPLSNDAVWKIREACIQQLSNG